MIERRIMLVSGECPWNCYFCGYGARKTKNYSKEEMKEQIDNYFKGFEPGKIDKLKVDMPGSVLDPNQVSDDTQRYLVKKCKEYGIDELVVETRPEFVNKNNLSTFGDIDLTVAIGLDVADDHYLRKLNKDFSLSDYETAATIAKACGCEVKTYVLVNPPFVKDEKKLLDKTVREALEYSDRVVLINCYPHEGTPFGGEFDEDLDEEFIEEIEEWEPLSKGEFFDLAKNWLVNPDVEYDLMKKEAPPTWKAWVPRFSDEPELSGDPEKVLLNPVCSTWQNFLREKYSAPVGKNILLLLPDLDETPRSESDFYQGVVEILGDMDLEDDVHLVAVTPVGIMPLEFDEYYPFSSYKWNFSELDGDEKEQYREITKERVRDYVASQRINYGRYVSALKPSSLTGKGVRDGFDEVSMDLVECLKEGDEEEFELTEEVEREIRGCLESLS